MPDAWIPALLLLVPAAPAGAPQDEEHADSPWSLPAGPIAELVAGLADTGPPAVLGPAWPDWSDAGPAAWGGEAPWRLWVELLRAEAAAARPDPERRTLLALLAKRQGRDHDAWRHLAALAPSNDGGLAGVAAVLPALFPGVPDEHLGTDGPLPEGVLLRPSLPPDTTATKAALRTLAGRSIEYRALRIGAAVLSLKVSVEGDGVQVDVQHLSGPEVRLRVQPPEPPGVDVAILYYDWERVADEPVPVEVVASAEEPLHTLWGRFLGHSGSWPDPRPPARGAHPPQGPLVLQVAERTARLDRLGEALSELFDVPCLQVPAGAPLPAGFREPTVLQLGGGPDPQRKLDAMISLIEAHALAGAAR